jgi:hypothetical protein
MSGMSYLIQIIFKLTYSGEYEDKKSENVVVFRESEPVITGNTFYLLK